MVDFLLVWFTDEIKRKEERTRIADARPTKKMFASLYMKGPFSRWDPPVSSICPRAFGMKRPVQRQPWHRRVHKKTSGLFMCPPATRFPPGSKTYSLLNVRLYRLLLAGNRSLRSRPAGSARSCAGEVTTAERKAPLLRREGLSSPQACVQQQRVHTALQSGRARKKTGGLERSSTCATVFPKRDFRSPFLSHRFLTVEGCRTVK